MTRPAPTTPTAEQQQQLRELAASRRAQGQPPAQIAARAGITRLWAWRLANGWTRTELLRRLQEQGDSAAEESSLWRWETGERDPSRLHLDYLCRVYQTRLDLLGYGHDYSPNPAAAAAALPGGGAILASEPLSMLQALTSSGGSLQTISFLERSAERACRATDGAAVGLLDELARQCRAVCSALRQGQRVTERRRLACVAARLGVQLGLLLWEHDRWVALAYFDVAEVAAEEAEDAALGAWVTERHARGNTRVATASYRHGGRTVQAYSAAPGRPRSAILHESPSA
jgi:transcriptional regulator with XRE-family HTH domain